MNPVYPLPKVVVKAAEPPRFLRDSMATGDVTGTSPAPLYRWVPRNLHDVGDIEGAAAGWKPPHKRLAGGARPDGMDVREINGREFRSSRVTDPLDPEHTVNGMTIRGDVKSKPRVAPPPHEGPQYNLLTSDIEGAVSG